MKLALIYNVWSDWSILKFSLKHMTPLVDGVIIVGSEYSNFGEHDGIPSEFYGLNLHIREPQFKNDPRASETDKRNFGLQIAKNGGYTHFLSIDADEIYDAEEFLNAIELFKNPNLKGLVVPCQTYFRSPTLTIGLDITLVPFIHELTPTIRHEFNRNYPYAWIKGQIRIDPTRSLNINSAVEYTESVVMHHYSWVRSDFGRKIRNSTARANLERSTITEDLVSAKEGYFCKFYQKHLTTVPNRFGIPDYGEHLDKDLQRLAPTGPTDKP